MNFDEKPERSVERAGYSVKEFSALFGKERTWGYRQIEKGRVVATIGFGIAIISSQEVKRILRTEGSP